MKGIRLEALPRGWTGYVARSVWKGREKRRRFSIRRYGGETEALERAVAWLMEAEREQGKPRTERWVRSRGASGRSGRRYTWKRG